MAADGALKAILDTLHFTGATRLARTWLQGMGAIFCLHHVCPGGGRDEGFAPNYQLEISPEFLDEVLSHLTALGFEFLSFAAAVDRLASAPGNGKPFAVFTLDDGYKDNMIHAAPVFRKHGCPYTIFVAPGIADGKCELWWRILELIIAKSPRFDFSVGEKRLSFDTSDIAEKSMAARTLFPAVKALPELEQRKWIHHAAATAGIDWQAYCASVAMTWDEIRALSKDPLCTIGAHTLNHYAVARLPEADAYHELRESKLRIEHELGRPVDHFAYPYGDEPAAGTRDFRLAEQAGYRASVTTRKGVVFPGHARHLHALPRVMMSGRYQKIRYLDALVSGLPFAMLNRFRKINVS